MKLYLLVVTICLNQLFAQDLNEFNERRVNFQKKGMIILGSWASANLITGTIGMYTTSGESRYFHQMNAGWNIVNLGLAIPGYLSARKENIQDLSVLNSLEAQRKVSNAYLFNSALNLTYITTGVLLRERAKNNPADQFRLRGFGNSFIFQGGALLLFDLSSYIIHQHNRSNRLDPILKNIQLGPNTLGFAFSL